MRLDQTPSFVKVPLAGLIACAIIVLCVLPPVLHFISGPLGPMIGGYTVGYWLKLRGSQALLTGALMGFGVGIMLLLSFERFEFMPNLAMQTVLPLSIATACYVGVLGGLGAWFARSAAGS